MPMMLLVRTVMVLIAVIVQGQAMVESTVL